MNDLNQVLSLEEEAFVDYVIKHDDFNLNLKDKVKFREDKQIINDDYLYKATYIALVGEV